MYFEFTCPKCRTSFSIPSTYMLDKNKILCPSCELALSAELLHDLKEIAYSVQAFKSDYEKIVRNSAAGDTLRVALSTVAKN